MAAELILSWTPAPESHKEMKAWQATATKEAMELSDEALEAACEHAFGASFFDMFAEGDADDPNELKPKQKLRERIRDAVAEIDDNRHVAWFPEGVLGGAPVFLTGGTSWGDMPEGADDINLIYGAGLLEGFAQ